MFLNLKFSILNIKLISIIVINVTQIYFQRNVLRNGKNLYELKEMCA
jgi:hypothetical protein